MKRKKNAAAVALGRLGGLKGGESDHISYRSRGGPDTLENLALLCPNHHTVVHATDATFDHAKLYSSFPTAASSRSASIATLSPAY